MMVWPMSLKECGFAMLRCVSFTIPSLRPIRVHICESELQLFGQVSSWHEKQQAQETAREMAPVYRIRNELRINPDPARRIRR